MYRFEVSKTKIFFIFIPSNYLSYSATFACSNDDSCALEFAERKLTDLAKRRYNSVNVTQELAPLLEESRQNGTKLRCFDGEICEQGGMCQIVYDTKANTQSDRRCHKPDLPIPARVSVYDSGNYATIDIECDRTACNSPETMNKVKAILARHNLTDADGRINGSSLSVASMIGIVIMLLFSQLFN